MVSETWYQGCWRIAKLDMPTIFMGDWTRIEEIFASPSPGQWPG